MLDPGWSVARGTVRWMKGPGAGLTQVGCSLYSGRQAPLDTMQPAILHIPLARLLASDAYPLTRDRVFRLARGTVEGAAREVHLVVTVDHEDEGLPIELVNVELKIAPNGEWCLQYVSHPAQSCGLTALIAPCSSDFVAFLQVREDAQLPHPLTTLCAQDLEDEGLGPLAMLNLRPGNPAPVVPSTSDLNQLVALAERMPPL